MDYPQTSISQRRGRKAARPRAGLAGYPAATASQVGGSLKAAWAEYEPKHQGRPSSGRSNG